jgi:Amt family ammonium transporter
LSNFNHKLNVHGVGGTIGAFAIGILMNKTANAAGGTLVDQGLLRGQLLAMGLCIVISLAFTWIIAKLIAKTIGLRPKEEESQGLDISAHGEEGYQHN